MGEGSCGSGNDSDCEWGGSARVRDNRIGRRERMERGRCMVARGKEIGKQAIWTTAIHCNANLAPGNGEAFQRRRVNETARMDEDGSNPG